MSVSRRSFINNSITSSLLLSLSPGLIGETLGKIGNDRRNLSLQSPPRRKFNMSLNPYLIGVNAKISQKELNTAAYKYGFESVATVVDGIKFKSSWQIQDLLGDMREKKLTWGLTSLPVEFRKSEKIYREDLLNLPIFAKALYTVGANRSYTWIMSSNSELNYLQNFRLHAVRLREIAIILNDYDIRLGLEYVGPRSIWSANEFPFIHTMAETKELISAIGEANVGFHLDTAHWYTANENISDLLTLTNKYIVGCDLDDAISGIDRLNQPGYQRLLPATSGVIETKEFLQALISIGYDGPIQAEPFNAALNKMDDEEAIKKTADAMRHAFNLVS